MDELDRMLYEAKELAEDAGDVAKTIAGDVVDRAKKLTEEGGKARELAKSAREQTASLSNEVKEKVQGVLSDGKAVKEIAQGIAQLEALPEIEGSILYTMELETAINYLKSLQLVISDNRMDSKTAAEEIRKVMDKVQPSSDPQEIRSEENQAIENVQAIAYNACIKTLEALGQAEDLPQ